MIAHLAGKLLHKSPDHLILDVNGVGYRIQAPLSTFYQLPGQGESANLYIHTHVREDALHLYGFNTLAEKEMFLHLLGISGVGPRLAISILSGIQVEELRQVIVLQDRQRLRKIPGVGKKTAERIMLELRDKLKVDDDRETAARPILPEHEGDGYADAFSALLNLGYRPGEAQKALRKARSTLGDDHAPVERLLKEALRLLA